MFIRNLIKHIHNDKELKESFIVDPPVNKTSCDDILEDSIKDDKTSEILSTYVSHANTTAPEISFKNSQSMDEQDKTQNISTNIVADFIQLFIELDNLYIKTTDTNVTNTIAFCQDRIIEILSSNGCKKIGDDLEFDCLRHIVNPIAFVPQGTPITETIRPGIICDDKVLLKAIVKVTN